MAERTVPADGLRPPETLEARPICAIPCVKSPGRERGARQPDTETRVTETGVMSARIRMRRFREDDDGAVTIDWVVLTAALVSLGTLVVAGLLGGMGQVSSRVDDHLSSATVVTEM